MTQRLFLPSVSLMSPLAAEVSANCKCYFCFKGPFALRLKAQVSVCTRRCLVLIRGKTKEASSIPHCGVPLWMRVQPVYVCSRGGGVFPPVFRAGFWELPCASARGRKGVCTALGARWQWRTEHHPWACGCCFPGQSGRSLCPVQLSWG